jgi:hypothetical protein
VNYIVRLFDIDWNHLYDIPLKETTIGSPLVPQIGAYIYYRRKQFKVDKVVWDYDTEDELIVYAHERYDPATGKAIPIPTSQK